MPPWARGPVTAHRLMDAAVVCAAAGFILAIVLIICYRRCTDRDAPCYECGYNLTGAKDRCPECGKNL